MNLPFIDKVAKRFTKSASEQAKKELKKTAIDLLPGILTIGGLIFGFFVFHELPDSDSGGSTRPYHSSTRITTNNYFLGDVSEEILEKILEGKK